ncbi:hypothetical protein BL240_02510 [Pseudomonas putida]|uniref:Uncharacterized protein n=1 Tax=Pseudomonas putida TaxID=303 RepID=A0A1L5PKH8_PSEPU|nr:hypothetical protein BL240_02510 [Pseudomonas putida]
MSYTDCEACAVPVGAGLPAKQATRCMAPASPVFAGEPAPTGRAYTRQPSIQPVKQRQAGLPLERP